MEKKTQQNNKKTKVLILFMSKYTAYVRSIKFSEHRIEIKFDKDPLAVEQNNYFTKIVHIFNIYKNLYIFYDSDHWPRNPTDNLKFKNCLFRATNIVIKKSMCIVDTESHLIVQAGGVLTITLLEML